MLDTQTILKKELIYIIHQEVQNLQEEENGPLYLKEDLKIKLMQ